MRATRRDGSANEVERNEANCLRSVAMSDIGRQRRYSNERLGGAAWVVVSAGNRRHFVTMTGIMRFVADTARHNSGAGDNWRRTISVANERRSGRVGSHCGSTSSVRLYLFTTTSSSSSSRNRLLSSPSSPLPSPSSLIDSDTSVGLVIRVH